MPQQHTHNTTPFTTKQHPIILICDHITSPANIGGLFRICDAFGIAKLVFNHEIDLTSPRLKKTARNTFKNVVHQYEEHLNTYINALKDQGYQAVGLEITSNSIPIQSFVPQNDFKLALIIGGEQHGLSEKLLPLLDSCLHIEMFGHNSSMNVTQATAIALYELTKT